QPALVEQHVQLVDRVESSRERADHHVAVAAPADQRVGAQVVVGSELAAGGDELALVGGAFLAGTPSPSGIDLQERVFDVAALLAHLHTVWRTALCRADAVDTIP